MEFNKKFFTHYLLKWNRMENDRLMPWKNEKNPYRIWISEIILQQTRVQQGLEYYKRFIHQFPTAESIAAASENEVFKLWEGLGYYKRCRNIIATARYITEKLGGNFPGNYAEILKLKGIGTYTASAIASFAYNLPHAVIDGNVFRVLSRFFGIKTPVDTPEGKKIFSLLAHELLHKKIPGIYNQAIMDFGAVVCKPLPNCNICGLSSRCVAYQQDLIKVLPVKEKGVKKRSRWFYFLVIRYQNSYYVRKRTAKDIWQNLYEFIQIEVGKETTVQKVQHSEAYHAILQSADFTVEKVSPVYKQQLTHQSITLQFIEITVKKPINLPEYILVSAEQILQLPFPKFINIYLKDKLLSLNLSSRLKPII